MIANATNKVTYKEIAITVFFKFLPLSIVVVAVFKLLQHLLSQTGVLISPSIQNGVLLIALLFVMKISAGKMLKRLFAEEFGDGNDGSSQK